jgi:hypothetical protein
MTIETKYNIGDEVWFMEDNHSQSGTVTGLRFSYGKGEVFGKALSHEEKVQVNYVLRGDFIHSGDILEEKFLFTTKEELLKSL